MFKCERCGKRVLLVVSKGGIVVCRDCLGSIN